MLAIYIIFILEKRGIWVCEASADKMEQLEMEQAFLRSKHQHKLKPMNLCHCLHDSEAPMSSGANQHLIPHQNSCSGNYKLSCRERNKKEID